MISYFPVPRQTAAKPLFSILIPTWNNLPFVKCCVESIRKNSTFSHQIILHLNEASDGTRQWAEAEGLDFTFSPNNVGICLACNAAYSLAQADYIVYMNDDMYACPEWDKHLWEAVEAYGKNDFYFSGTMIERLDAQCSFVSSPHDFGSTVENFQEQKLLDTYATLAIADWQGANYPPSLMHRQYWDLIGGFSIELSPGMYSDPDICRKLWAVGVRNFKGVGQSLVYHFMSKSVGRIQKNDGKRQFLEKWGLSARAFFDIYLHQPIGNRPTPYLGILSEPAETASLRWQRFRAQFKKRFL
jgi:glycosyltransferase involved in cell wall biosynthesis